MRLEGSNRVKEADFIFEQLRKDAILKQNMEEVKKANPLYQRERRNKNEDMPVMCKICNGMYSRKYFCYHQKSCHESTTPLRLDTFKNDEQYSDDFKEKVLGKLANDTLGNKCRNDATLKAIGLRFFFKANRKGPTQINDCAKTVRTDMRRIAGIKEELESIVGCHIDTRDMFRRKYLDELKDAIENFCRGEESGSIKAGLKYAIQFLLKRAADALKAKMYKEEKDEEAEDIRKWVEVFSGERNIMFGDAIYQLGVDSQRKLRMPGALPSNAAVQKVRDESLKRINTVVSDQYHLRDVHSFVSLRNALVTRLTLFNGKRGGEPARLTLAQYQECVRNEWIQKDDPRWKDDPYIQWITQQIKVAYQVVKGGKLVPVYFPKDTMEGCNLMASPEFRTIGNVNAKNPFLFPSTRKTADLEHVCGGNALDHVCRSAELTTDDIFTFTQNRHRISTLYAALDVDDSSRELFFKGLGHSKQMNETRYQVPEALEGVVTVATNLQDIDLG